MNRSDNVFVIAIFPYVSPISKFVIVFYLLFNTKSSVLFPQVTLLKKTQGDVI